MRIKPASALLSMNGGGVCGESQEQAWQEFSKAVELEPVVVLYSKGMNCGVELSLLIILHQQHY